MIVLADFEHAIAQLAFQDNVIVSAILDALRPLGVRDIPMPATSYAIWSAIQRAKTRHRPPQPGEE